jgi:hypothetical protein
MRYYSRVELIGILHVDEGFLISLEQEEIIARDAPAGGAGEFSEQMLERARVACNLVNELEVNLAGAAIIVRMREQMATLRHELERVLGERGGGREG